MWNIGIYRNRFNSSKRNQLFELMKNRGPDSSGYKKLKKIKIQ